MKTIGLKENNHWLRAYASSNLCITCQENEKKHQPWHKENKYMDFKCYHLTTFVWFPGYLKVTVVSRMLCNFQNLQHYLLTESTHSLDLLERTLSMHKFNFTPLQNNVFLNITFFLLKMQVFGCCLFSTQRT